MTTPQTRCSRRLRAQDQVRRPPLQHGRSAPEARADAGAAAVILQQLHPVLPDTTLNAVGN